MTSNPKISPKKQFAQDLQIKDSIQDSFLLKALTLQEGRDQRFYLSLILGDKTGDLDCRLWQEAIETSQRLTVGTHVMVKGKVNLYQGRKQVVLTEIQEITEEDRETLHLEDYIPTSAIKSEDMYRELCSLVNSLEEDVIRELLRKILHEPSIAEGLKYWSAGKTIHHTYEGGLLEHILSCTKLAKLIAPSYPVQLNYVVAGCILHDLCKIYELTRGPNVEYTEEGRLIGHLCLSLELVDHFAAKIPEMSPEVKMHIKHILISHHGEYEYGSPKIPQTSEAMLVHLIDLMDSKMNAFETVKKSDPFAGAWSGYVKHLDRMIYKEALPSPETLAPLLTSSPQVVTNSPKKEKPMGTMGKLLEGFKIKS